MQQERLMILRMLAEGKIAPEEAAALLDALEDKAEAAPRPARDQAENLVENMAGLAGRVASWGAEFGARVAEEIREGRVPVLRWIGNCFDGRETVTERHGEFAGGAVTVECFGEAGSFMLRGGEGPEYRLVVRQRFGPAGGPSIESDGNRLSVSGNGIMRAELDLPRDRRYRLNLRSSAGRIEVAGLAAGEAAIATEAGSIRLADLSAERISLRSAAGTVEAAGLDAPELRAETSCGRVHLELAPSAGGRASVSTDVGAVSLVVPLRPGIAYRLRARADVGSIACDPPFRVTEEDRSIGRRWLAAETPGPEGCQVVEIDANTDFGSIRVATRG